VVGRDWNFAGCGKPAAIFQKLYWVLMRRQYTYSPPGAFEGKTEPPIAFGHAAVPGKGFVEVDVHESLVHETPVRTGLCGGWSAMIVPTATGLTAFQ
jgi:hypothetical protein